LQKKPKAAECINHRTYSKDSSEDTAMTDWKENWEFAWRRMVWI
jgi:hypothetical protein